MKRVKSSRPRDRLSELPESLIFRIFWILPMRDVVRTTILSKHWKNLWTTSPCLNFDYDHTCDNPDIFRDLVNQALISWEGTRILKFKIDFHFMAGKSGYRDFDYWLYFAMRKNVQELYVHNPWKNCGTYLVPQNLHSCSSLKVLSLVDCRVKMSGDVQWNQLQSLTIDGAYMSEDAINQVLCGSPQLKVFILTLVDNTENLSIRSRSLKTLSINHEVIDYEPCLHMELRIWTPNLETLEISGTPYSKCLLMDVSSLTHLTLGFRFQRHLVDGIDLLQETLRQVFPSIQHVQSLTLSDSTIQVLGEMIKKKSLVPSSSNAKLLKLKNNYAEYKQVVGVVEIFPKLTMLSLNGNMREFDANLPNSFLLHLRTIEIRWGSGANLLFPFIKTVLKFASKLEKMVIRVSPQPSDAWPLKSLYSASQKLLRMPRSSPNAELIFYEC